MWAAFSNNFAGFAQNFATESAGFVETFNQLANDLAYSGVYAGDEHTPEAQEMPLETETLLPFQHDRETYTVPFSEEEQRVFVQWARISPFSSQRARERVQAGEGRPLQYADEPADVLRQKLLDYSEAVHDQYVALVGSAVSPRSHGTTPQGSPAQPNRADNNTSGNSGGASPEQTPEKTAAAGVADEEGTPQHQHARTGGLVSEDDFFDRYYFRLAQLRIVEAQKRADAQAQREKKREASGETSHDAHKDGNEGHFAKRIMRVANEFVHSIDEAVMGTGRSADSDADNVTPPGEFSKTHELEKVVQELQEELRRERRRVHQLESIMRDSGIPIPAAPEPTPVKPAAAAAVAESSTPQQKQE